MVEEAPEAQVADTIGWEYYEHGAAPRIATVIERVG
jgi:hypothetical protein